MFDELLPMTLSVGAVRIGVEPLELVRLMVHTDTITPNLHLSPAQLDVLVEAGGIESGWWDGVELPPDSTLQRSVVRAALGILAERAAGAKPVRMDNLWRGRPLEEQGWIESALDQLCERAIVQIHNAPEGVQVRVDEAGLARLRLVAAGEDRSLLESLLDSEG